LTCSAVGRWSAGCCRASRRARPSPVD
jgi:hypothetical protein